MEESDRACNIAAELQAPAFLDVCKIVRCTVHGEPVSSYTQSGLQGLGAARGTLYMQVRVYVSATANGLIMLVSVQF